MTSRMVFTVRAACRALVVAGGALWAFGAAAEPCDPSLLHHMPARATDAMGGSAFARRIDATSGPEREAAIARELASGNVPSFLRRLVPVSLSAARSGGRLIEVTACVLPDYLAVGSDQDFLIVPMALATALRVAARDGFTLPTPKLVDAIYAQAAVHLPPRPLPASDEMRSTAYYTNHDRIIGEQRSALRVLLGSLVAGHKKDLVLTNRLWNAQDRVAIYGWHRPDANPIQPLSTVHGERYADYSHGVRLVSTTVYVDGAARPIAAALADPEVAPALSSEGPMPRYDALIATLTTRPAKAAALDATASCSSGNPGDSSRGCARP